MKTKRFLSVLIALAMLVGMLPTFAFANEAGVSGAEAVQIAIDALPDACDIESGDEEVIASLASINDAKLLLDDEEEIDWTKYEAATLALNMTEGQAGLMISKTYINDIDGPQSTFRLLDESGEAVKLTTYSGEEVLSAQPETNGEAEVFCLPAGTYKIDEQVEGEWDMSLNVNGDDISGDTITLQGGAFGDVIVLNSYSWFDVIIDSDIQNGTVTPSSYEIYPFDELILTVEADEGYELESLTVTRNSEGSEILTTKTGDNTYAFTLDVPLDDVFVTATFTEIETPLEYDVYVGGIGMTDGDYLVNGEDEVTDEEPVDTGYAYYENGVLTLENYEYTGDGYIYDYYDDEEVYSASIYSEQELEIVLVGENALSNTLGFYCEEITVLDGGLTIRGDGKLTLDVGGTGIYVSENCENGLVIESGTLDIRGETGIYSDADIEIYGGDIKIEASGYDGIYSYGDIEIYGGNINISAYDSCLKAVCYIGIYGGQITVYSEEDQAIEAYDEIYISDGTIYAVSEYDLAIATYLLEMEDNMQILLPKNGEIGVYEEDCTVVDEEGNGAYAVYITSGEHEWSEEYAFDATHHWHPCEDEDCLINGIPEICDGYEEHEEGECICGYDTEKEAAIYVGGIGLANGEYLSNNLVFSDEKPSSGGYAHYSDGVLTLDDFEYKGGGYATEEYGDIYYSSIYTETDLDIVLKGESTLENIKEYGYGISVYGDVTVKGNGTLNLIAKDNTVNVYDGNFTMEKGTLNITTDEDGINIETHDMEEKGNVFIKGGNITINSGDDGLNIGGYMESVENSYLTISGGTVVVDAYDVAIDVYNDVLISGGKVTLTSHKDEGIWIMGDFKMTGGTLNITSKEEGIWAEPWYHDDPTSGGNISFTGGTATIENTDPDYFAVAAYGNIEIGKNVKIVTPTNGEVIGAAMEDYDNEVEVQTVGVGDVPANKVVIKKKTSSGGGVGGSYVPKQPEPEKEDEDEKLTDKEENISGGNTSGTTGKKIFDDVHPVKHWAIPDVDFVYANGIMNGVSETLFAPDEVVTRAMLVTVLYREEGEPATNRSIPFADVDMGAYYANAVSWAKQNGIVFGISENEFAPDDNITREQIAAIMHRYAEFKGYDVSAGDDIELANYDDFGSVSDYAIIPVKYAVGSGLIKGKTERTINPREFATRAEIAAIIHRFIENNR